MEPITIRLGTCNTYLIKGEAGWILIDAGNKGRAGRFFRKIKEFSLKPEDIRLVFLTHSHFDHVGGLAEIKRKTGAKVLVHEVERQALEEGRVEIPPGTNLFGRISSFIGKAAAGRLITFEPVRPEYVAGPDSTAADFGLPGRLILTPGHTLGSMSLLLDTGEAFVGDALINSFGMIFPPFAVDPVLALDQWRNLLEAGGRVFYPSHGRPVSAERLRAELNRRL